jgi:hypothetical protein
MESRRWIATIVALFALVALSLGSRDAHAVDAKYLCNPSGSQCVSMTPTDWEFYPTRWIFPLETHSAARRAGESAQTILARPSLPASHT